AQGPLPLSVNGIESLVYTFDVQVGTPPQRFNLTLDANIEAPATPVLFSKRFVASKHPCDTRDAHRNLFDPTYVQGF
ncbi:hypothetical protein AAVH_30442, partial [Aphelenchoides avenae]